jgi:hypothetical protein
MKLITVPKTPKSAYNPKRKVSSLLKAHIANLEAVAHKRPGATYAKRPKTEGQASAYIADLTRQLHPEIGAPQPVAAVQPAPVAYPIPGVPAAPSTRKVRRKKVKARKAKATTKPATAARKRARRTRGAKR